MDLPEPGSQGMFLGPMSRSEGQGGADGWIEMLDQPWLLPPVGGQLEHCTCQAAVEAEHVHDHEKHHVHARSS